MVVRRKMFSHSQFGKYTNGISNLTAEQRQQEIARLEKELAEARQQDIVNTALDRSRVAQGDTTSDTLKNRNIFAASTRNIKRVESPIEGLKKQFNSKCKLWKEKHQILAAKYKEKNRSLANENIDEQINDIKARYADATELWEWQQANAMVDAYIHGIEGCIKELENPSKTHGRVRPKMPSLHINTFG